MSTSCKNILLLGATGTTGAPILEGLLASKAFNVSVAIRNTSKPHTFPSTVKGHTVDYGDPSTLAPAFAGQDAIVSALTTFATPQQRAIIDAAVTAGVKRFIPSEFGIDTSKPEAEEWIPATAMKRTTVAYLKEQESRGLSWSTLCVGAYFDPAFMASFWGYDFKNNTAPIRGDENMPFEATTLPRVADAIVKILQHPQETANQYIYVHSFRITQAQQLAIFEKALGSKFSTTHHNLQQVYDEGRKNMSTTELNDGVAMVILAVLCRLDGDVRLNDFGEKAEYWGKVLGLPDEGLEETVGNMAKQMETGS